MNPNEMNEKFDDLTAQVDEMNQRLEDAREERGELLLSNLTGALPGTLRPYEARIYLKNRKGEH